MPGYNTGIVNVSFHFSGFLCNSEGHAIAIFHDVEVNQAISMGIQAGEWYRVSTSPVTIFKANHLRLTQVFITQECFFMCNRLAPMTTTGGSDMTSNQAELHMMKPVNNSISRLTCAANSVACYTACGSLGQQIQPWGAIGMVRCYWDGDVPGQCPVRI